MSKKRLSDLDFAELRKRLGLNQADMAGLMGLSLRAYQMVEAGEAPGRHVAAAHWVSLAIAVDRGDASLATPEAAKLARDFAALGKPRRRLL